MTGRMNWLDYLIILVYIIGLLRGYGKGIIKNVFNIVSMFVALVLSWYFTMPAVKFLVENTNIYANTRKVMQGRITKLDPITIDAFKLFDLSGKETIDMLSRTVLNAGCFIGIFIVLSIVIAVVRNIMSDIIKHGPLSWVDKTVGACLGVFFVTVLMFVFFAIAPTFAGLLKQGDILINAIGTSKLAKYFYLYNFMIPLIENIKYA